MTTHHRLVWFVNSAASPPPGRSWPTLHRPEPCATVAEGVAEATRTLLVLAAFPVERDGRPVSVEGRVACGACGSSLASFSPEAPGAWFFDAYNAYDCAVCAGVEREMGLEGRRNLRPAEGAMGAARRALGAWCRRLIHAGGVARVELGASLDDDPPPRLDLSLRVVAAGFDSRAGWEVSVSSAGVSVEEACEPAGLEGSVAARLAWEALGARVGAFARELEAMEVRHAGRPDAADGCTLRGRELLVAACVPDDVIAWDAMGGPFYAEPNRQRI